ncbi:MAG TPA: hypothetical protein VG371_02305 [Solirubrobacteraceae bacterium]|jgi:hypothetical protein|nr:hypothetical protein [Solirubrobacteraceae bacterium]
MTGAILRAAGGGVGMLAALALLAPNGDATSPPKVVLGARAFAPMGAGFGTVKPKTIFNGGDPSGLVQDITWSRWGSSTATATGKTSIFKPKGGYYPGLVRAELRASRLGHCRAHGPLAYTRLEAREPTRPGGPLGKWFLWSGQKSICVGP